MRPTRSANPTKGPANRDNKLRRIESIPSLRALEPDLDTAVLFSLLRRRVLVEGIGFAAPFRGDAGRIAHLRGDDRSCRVGARRGQLEIGRKLDRMNRLVVGIADHLDGSFFLFEVGAD